MQIRVLYCGRAQEVTLRAMHGFDLSRDSLKLFVLKSYECSTGYLTRLRLHQRMHLRCMQTGSGDDSIWNQGIFAGQEIRPFTTVIVGSCHDMISVQMVLFPLEYAVL